MCIYYAMVTFFELSFGSKQKGATKREKGGKGNREGEKKG